MKIKNDKKSLFFLARPFIAKGKVKINKKIFEKWGLDDGKIELSKNLEEAHILLIPYDINYYFDNRHSSYLEKYNSLCGLHGIRGIGIISGDFGVNFPPYGNLTYVRYGGFKKQLDINNKGFPAALSDQNMKLFSTERVSINEKKERPTIGFCGHATNNATTYLHQSFNFVRENISRFFKDPLNSVYEPIFQSANERYKILKKLEIYPEIITNFIYRDKYRAGANTEYQLKRTTMEHYQNIRSSDYVICLRGTGNFSIRFYETLMMGRIPIFIDTDCFLPFSNLIAWKDHIIIVKWDEISNLKDAILNFHQNISSNDFKHVQKSNRMLWKEKLNPQWILENLLEI